MNMQKVNVRNSLLAVLPILLVLMAALLMGQAGTASAQNGVCDEYPGADECQTPGSISGTVTDEAGQPLQGIDVSVFQLVDFPWGGSAWLTVANAATDVGGNYSVGELGSRDYKVGFNIFGDNNYVREYFDNQTDLDSADPVAVIAGSTTPGINAALAEGGSITGTVIDEAGQPLQGMYITVYKQVPYPDPWGSSWFSVRSAITDANGNYSVGGLLNGEYTVGFNTYPNTNDDYLTEYYNDKLDIYLADLVQVTAGSNTSGIDAVLSVSGRISGTVTDEAGQPLQYISVNVYKLNNASGNWDRLGYAETDANGNYLVARLGGGDFKIEFRSYSGNYALEFYNDKPDFDLADLVSLTQGSEASGINASLAAGGSISGTVTDEAGQPLQQGSVAVYEYDSIYKYWSFAGSVSTDGSGNYSVDGLQTGEYKIEFNSANHFSEYYNDKPDLDSADLVSVSVGNATEGIDAILVSCSGEAPDLQLTRGRVFWASYADYTARHLSVDYTVSNPAGPDAFDVNITWAANNPSDVTLEMEVPLQLGDISTGAIASTTLVYYVPVGVKSFKSTVHAIAYVACGNSFTYPSP